MNELSYDREITALLVIDPYNDFISEGGHLWDRVKAVAEANNCVSNMLEVLYASRQAGVRVFCAVHHRSRPGDYERWKYIAPIQKRAWRGKSFEYGTWRGEIRSEFRPLPGEIVAHEQWCSSGFANTDLDQLLKTHGVHRLIMIGLLANTCLEATARFGAELGYDVTVVRDATAALSEEEMHAALDINLPNLRQRDRHDQRDGQVPLLSAKRRGQRVRLGRGCGLVTAMCVQIDESRPDRTRGADRWRIARCKRPAEARRSVRVAIQREALMQIRAVLRGLALAALTASVAACGGGGSTQPSASDDEAEVVAVVKRVASTTDPADCTRLATQRFLEQNEIGNGKAAVESCQQDARDAAGNARSTTVSNVRIDGDTAQARAAFDGGDLDGQVVNLRVIKDRGRWRVDHVDSFASFDRKRFLHGVEESVRRPPQSMPAADAACIVGRLDKLSDLALQQLLVSGDNGRIATVAGPCIVNLLRRELVREGVSRSVADCVVGEVDRPPYDALRRVFDGADASQLFAEIAKTCVTG